MAKTEMTTTSIIIKKEILEQLFEKFKKQAQDYNGTEFVSFVTCKYLYQDDEGKYNEGYKKDIYKKASNLLENANWKKEDIGSGSHKIFATINEIVQQKISRNLITNFRTRDNFSKMSVTKDFEELLYNLYQKKENYANDEITFEKLHTEYKLNYNLISYLFFIKQPAKYMPLAQDRFNKIFKNVLQINFNVREETSWNNYTTYNQILEQVRGFLKTKDKDCTLLDAHSFLYVMQDEKIEIKIDENMEKFISLLKSNKNLILTGAPGTGKTYLAKEIAKYLVNQTAETTIKESSNNESIMEIDWSTYYKLVQSEKTNTSDAYNCLTERLAVIHKVQGLFNTGKHFCDFSDDDRKYVAGTLGDIKRYQFSEDSGFFGQMSGNGKFAGAINSNSKEISNALDEIPIKGNITQQNYDSFAKNFKEAINGNMVGCASRLLAMKRPDFFVCINGGNKDGLKKDFDDKNLDKSFDDYWNFIKKVHKSEWYDNPTPKTDIEKEVISARVALLDSIYYDKTITTFDKIANLSLNNSEINPSNIAFVQFHPSYDYTDFVEGLRPKKETDENKIGFELKNGVFKEFCKKALVECKYIDGKFDEENSPRYVFIIDEINRGEISKIFGELFFSIEPSYRGIEGKVQTQYANIQSTETIFDENLGKGWFYVPENVYIIGTMNDIDRSVESFDFAMRRRFTWKEITAEESAENMKLPKEVKDKMAKLNHEISKIAGLNASYHIGGAYFLDKDDKARTDYDTVWELRLKPLLKEYLRGMPDSEVKENLEKLENAYHA